MRAITMTAEQTRRWNSTDDEVSMGVGSELLRKARVMAKETGGTVEVYTADGELVHACHPGDGE